MRAGQILPSVTNGLQP